MPELKTETVHIHIFIIIIYFINCVSKRKVREEKHYFQALQKDIKKITEVTLHYSSFQNTAF